MTLTDNTKSCMIAASKANNAKGNDGEKYLRRSGTVSGGEWKPRPKKRSEEHSVAAIRTRKSVGAPGCDRYITRA